jgi:adenylyltransferase/sulfurtransferase
MLEKILGFGESLAGRLLIRDALASRFRSVRLRPDPHCALCGPEATIKDLSAHRARVAGAGAERAETAPACAV